MSLPESELYVSTYWPTSPVQRPSVVAEHVPTGHAVSVVISGTQEEAKAMALIVLEKNVAIFRLEQEIQELKNRCDRLEEYRDLQSRRWEEE